MSKSDNPHITNHHSMIFQTFDSSDDEGIDIIKMKTDIVLTDKSGNIIEIKAPRPEYSSEIFS